ncbi:DUF2625 family protein [Streptomyces sp. KLMMK]|uniref:DUF2625 family protein n=1 Tax=Streptomyces sp. KLMMK TaxID=3109353 RepID=UPI0030004E24
MDRGPRHRGARRDGGDRAEHGQVRPWRQDGSGWREEAAALAFSQGISLHPFLWSEEAHGDLAATSRRPVPMGEVIGIAADFAQQVGPSDPGFLGDV